jgi:hypothetical protein
MRALYASLGAAVQNYWTYEAKPEYQFFDVSISMVDGSLHNDTVVPVARPLWVSADSASNHGTHMHACVSAAAYCVYSPAACSPKRHT